MAPPPHPNSVPNLFSSQALAVSYGEWGPQHTSCGSPTQLRGAKGSHPGLPAPLPAASHSAPERAAVFGGYLLAGSWGCWELRKGEMPPILGLRERARRNEPVNEAAGDRGRIQKCLPGLLQPFQSVELTVCFLTSALPLLSWAGVWGACMPGGSFCGQLNPSQGLQGQREAGK